MRTERIDEHYLASYRLQTPCFKNGFCYEQLVIRYRSINGPATLQVKLRFANHEVKMRNFDLKDSSGFQVIRIDPREKGEITGYLIELYQEDIKLDSYSHLWVEPIVIPVGDL